MAYNVIARHPDTWPTCAVVVTTIVSDHLHTAMSLHDEQGHALPIARLLLQDLLHGTHFWLLFETLTHMLLSVVD